MSSSPPAEPRDAPDARDGPDERALPKVRYQARTVRAGPRDRRTEWAAFCDVNGQRCQLTYWYATKRAATAAYRRMIGALPST